MKNRPTRHIAHIIILGGLILFFAFPILWIVLVSVQPGNVAYSGRYRFLPKEMTLHSYAQAFTGSAQGVYQALIYSFKIAGISTLLSLLFALSAVYIIKADMVSAKLKKRTLQWSIGLYFLPVFLVYPALQMLSGIISSPTLQLVIVDTILGYVIALILLLIVYASSQSSHFEQLLLETGSRPRAFYYGVVASQAAGTMVVMALTFATIWSEFFLSNLITTTQSTKPFSVVLQMAQGQYGTDYSVFAAGSVLSLFVWIIFFVIVFALGLSAITLARRKGRAWG